MKPRSVTVHASTSSFFSEEDEFYSFNDFEAITRLAAQAIITTPSVANLFHEEEPYVEYTVHMDNGKSVHCSMGLNASMAGFSDYVAWILTHPKLYGDFPNFDVLSDIKWTLH